MIEFPDSSNYADWNERHDGFSLWDDFNRSFEMPDAEEAGWADSIADGINHPLIPIPIVTNNECEVCITFLPVGGNGASQTICYRKPNCREKPLETPIKLPEFPNLNLPSLLPDTSPQDLGNLMGWIQFRCIGTYYYTWIGSLYRSGGEWDVSESSSPSDFYIWAYNPTAAQRKTEFRASGSRGCQSYWSGWKIQAWAVWWPAYNLYYYPDANGWCYTPASVTGDIGSFRNCSIVSFNQAQFEQVPIMGFIGGLGLLEEPPINPPINQEDNPMDCCEELKRELREVHRKVHKIGMWTGSFGGGMIVPENLMDNSPGDGWLENAWDAITPDKKRNIKDIPAFLVWYIEKFQEIFGLFPMKFADKQGNIIGYPNVGEALKAIGMKQVSQEEQFASLQIAASKNLLETALTRHQVILCTSIADAIADWAEIHLKEDIETVTHQFKFPADRDVEPEEIDSTQEFMDFLEPSSVNAMVRKFDPTHKPDGVNRVRSLANLSHHLLTILEILKAVHSVPIDRNDPVSSLKAFVREYKTFSKGRRLDGTPIAGNDDQNDISKWANSVELQFSDTPGEAPTESATSPWGKSPEERPKILVKGQPPTEADDM